MTLPFRRIAVLTGDQAPPNPAAQEAHQDDGGDRIAREAMQASFESLEGYDFAFWTDHSRLQELLRNDPPDLLVNFCQTGLRNEPTQELHVPAVLDLLGIPYTGAPPAAIAICIDKAIVRLAAQAHGVPVPRETFIAGDAPLDALPDDYPALIKPNGLDGSVGITKDAVVNEPDEARRYLSWLRETLPGCDALWQEYLPGPEYGLGLIGNPNADLRVLPALEVDFSRLPEGLAPILPYEAKAVPDSPYWTEISFRRAGLSAEDERRLADFAQLLFRRLGLRDYGRFDFRVGADGEAKLMEVKPNPAWANDGKLAFMAGFAGIEYGDMLRLILEAALARLKAN